MYEAIELIKKYEASGSSYGLEREKALLAALGNPDGRLKIIHVAGTNGKGTTCEYLTQILLAAGKRVGTFTSPAVYDFNEMFKLNGKPVADAMLDKYLRIACERALELPEKPTAFEIETAAAFRLFEGEGCEYAVIECGMGGLNDSTNAVEKKELAVITSISLEHTAYLGDTILEICKQKGGIVRGCPLVCSALLPDEAKQYFAGRGAIFAGQSLKIVNATRCGQVFECDGVTYEIRMPGRAQAYNAAVAAHCAGILGISAKAIKEGLFATVLAGRTEIIERRGVTYVLDGCHNPESFGPLSDVVKTLGGFKALVFGCLSDKDIVGNIRKLSALTDEITAVRCSSPRAADTEQIVRVCRKYFKTVRSAQSVAQALDGQNAEVVVVCGSFTILKEAKQWIEKK